MIESISMISKTEQSAAVTLLSFCSDKSFEEVIVDFEKQVGRFDEKKALL